MNNEDISTLNSSLQTSGAVLNGIGSRREMQRAREYSKQLMDYQNQMNIDNWNLQNEYNSPKAQMQRYIDAGLNPNLIYSKSDMSGAIGQSSYIPTDPLKSYGSIANDAVNTLGTTFMDTYNKYLAIQSAKLNNKSRSYSNDLLATEVRVAEQTLYDRLEATSSRLRADISQAYEDEQVSWLNGDKAQYEREVWNEKSFQERLDYYRQQFKSDMIDFAIQSMFGIKDAQNESNLLEFNAKLVELDKQFQEDLANLNFSEMTTGNAVRILLQTMSHVFGFATPLANSVSGIIGRHKDRSLRQSTSNRDYQYRVEERLHRQALENQRLHRRTYSERYDSEGRSLGTTITEY